MSSIPETILDVDKSVDPYAQDKMDAYDTHMRSKEGMFMTSNGTHCSSSTTGTMSTMSRCHIVNNLTNEPIKTVEAHAKSCENYL
jgi:hypothetical protein